MRDAFAAETPIGALHLGRCGRGVFRGVFRPGGATRADRLAWAIRPWGDGRYPFSVGVDDDRDVQAPASQRTCR